MAGARYIRPLFVETGTSKRSGRSEKSRSTVDVLESSWVDAISLTDDSGGRSISRTAGTGWAGRGSVLGRQDRDSQASRTPESDRLSAARFDDDRFQWADQQPICIVDYVRLNPLSINEHYTYIHQQKINLLSCSIYTPLHKVNLLAMSEIAWRPWAIAKLLEGSSIGALMHKRLQWNDAVKWHARCGISRSIKQSVKQMWRHQVDEGKLFQLYTTRLDQFSVELYRMSDISPTKTFRRSHSYFTLSFTFRKFVSWAVRDVCEYYCTNII